MDNKKLKVKDLVSIGVFGVIYFAFMFGDRQGSIEKTL